MKFEYLLYVLLGDLLDVEISLIYIYWREDSHETGKYQDVSLAIIASCDTVPLLWYQVKYVGEIEEQLEALIQAVEETILHYLEWDSIPLTPQGLLYFNQRIIIQLLNFLFGVFTIRLSVSSEMNVL